MSLLKHTCMYSSHQQRCHNQILNQQLEVISVWYQNPTPDKHKQVSGSGLSSTLE